MHHLLETAVAKLVLKAPFISCIVLSTKIEEDNKFPFKAGTDGDTIIFNTAEIAKLSNSKHTVQEYTKFLIAHEAYHIALQHMFRRGSRDVIVMDGEGKKVLLWNLACDAVINEMLKKDGYTMIPGGVEYAGADEMSSEEVYDKMYKDLKNNPNVKWIAMDDLMDGNPDGDGDKEGNGQQPMSQQEREMRNQLKVQKALDVAKACGNLPASLQRLVEAAMEPKIDWRDQLREAVTTIMKKDEYTWSKLNRRYIWNNQYMPGMEGETTGPIFIAFDTSGSIGGPELSGFLAEMNSIFDEVKPERIMVGFCDCTFYAPHTDLTEDDLPMEPKEFSKITKGGGGTAFKPVFDYVKQQGIHPEMLIYFTDLCGSDFGDNPSYPVLWVSTHSMEAPWGKVIKLDMNS